MVFPYVNMLSYWVYLLAVLVLVASFFVPGGPTGAGWTLYPPQTILEGSPGHEYGIILMLVSLALFIVGFTMGGLNYVVTVLQARTGHVADAHAVLGWAFSSPPSCPCSPFRRYSCLPERSTALRTSFFMRRSCRWEGSWYRAVPGSFSAPVLVSATPRSTLHAARVRMFRPDLGPPRKPLRLRYVGRSRYRR